VFEIGERSGDNFIGEIFHVYTLACAFFDYSFFRSDKLKSFAYAMFLDTFLVYRFACFLSRRLSNVNIMHCFLIEFATSSLMLKKYN